MIHAVVSVSADEFTLPTGIEEAGSYNFMPKPFREAEADEYYHHVAHYTPLFMEYRQVKDLPGLGFSAVRIHWYVRQGWAIRYPNRWRSRRPEDGEGYSLIWEEPIRYYKIGCDHLFRTVERKGQHDERRECEHCAASMWVNTS